MFSTIQKFIKTPVKMQFSFELLSFIFLITLYSFGVECATETESDYKDQQTGENLNETESIPQDLYIIKTVVYEVGILTDASNDTDNVNQTHEQVDVSIYNPLHNGSAIDLSNIPLPIETNVSGVSITGLVPGANLASLLSPNPALPNKQITVTQNISTKNPDKGSEIISNLPKILGLTSKNDSKDDKET